MQSVINSSTPNIRASSSSWFMKQNPLSRWFGDSAVLGLRKEEYERGV